MYRSKRIDSSNISDYEKQIPENYVAMIHSGKYFGGAVFDPDVEEERVIMTYVMTIRSGWMELVWLGVFDRSREDMLYAPLIRTMVRKECFQRGEPIKGVYAEFYTDVGFQAERIRNVLILAGMESSISKGNIYEFSLRDITKLKLPRKALGGLKCVCLNEADGQLLDKLDEMLQQDNKPAPLPLFVNWDAYLKDESLICIREEDPYGVLLFSKRMDVIVIDCAFVTDKLALAVMLEKAYEILISKYGEDQKILVPVVVDRTAAILERLVPTAKRGEVVEAVMRFE